MRFLHTADWHLGRQLYGHSLLEDQAYLLDRLVEMARDARPDAVVVAGDLYDRAVPPTDAVRLLDDTLARLALDGGTKVLAITGNHDSAERLSFGSRLMQSAGLHLAADPRDAAQVVVLNDDHGEVAFCLLPYAEPAIVRGVFASEEDEPVPDHAAAMRGQIARALDVAPAGSRRVAVAHAFVAGGEESESERRLVVGGSAVVPATVFEPFAYTALGHLHRPQKVGGDNIRYSGSIYPYSASEADDPKSVALVEIDAAGAARVEFLPLAPRRPLVRLEGTFDELLHRPDFEIHRGAYIIARRTDHTSILDPMARLRERFPHCLHMELPLAAEAALGAAMLDDADKSRRRPLEDLFRDFCHDIAALDPTPEQAALVEEIVAHLRAGDTPSD